MPLRPIHPVRVALGAVGIAVGVVGVLALREATLSTHQDVDATSTAVLVLDAESKDREHGRTLDEMVEALVLSCRLEVGDSDLDGVIERHPGNRYVATFRPALDQTNRRQLRGCLEDWTIDHVRLDVVSLISR